MAAQSAKRPLGGAGAPPTSQRTSGPLMGRAGRFKPPATAARPPIGRLDMADTKQSPTRQTVKDFVRKSPSELTGSAHPCNDPSLNPLEFLQAVYRDASFPMSIRIDAARGLLPYTEPRPTNSFPPRRTIVIGGLGDHGSAPEDPEQFNTKSQSSSVRRSNNPHPQSGATRPLYSDENPEPSPLIDYSTPPTPSELQEIKAAINQLRPDLSHLPIPEPHLCSCGHWIFGPCPLSERCRDGSKLN